MLYALLAKSAKANPNAIALWSHNYQCTYYELDEKVKMLSQELLKRNLQKGDRIACHLHNCPEAIQLYFACFKIGISIVFIYPNFRQFEIQILIETAQPKLIVTQTALYPNFQKLIENATLLEEYFIIIDCLDNEKRNILPFVNFLDRDYASQHTEQDNVSADQEAAIFLTSGSTGRSKCVRTTESRLLCQLEAYDLFNHDHTDRFLLISVMNSFTGFVGSILPAIRHGARICYLPSIVPREEYLKAIPPVFYEQNITRILCISSTLRSLVEEIIKFTDGNFRKNSLRSCLVGGERLTKSSYEQTKKHLAFYPTEVYGLTETGICAVIADDPPVCGRFKTFGDTKLRITNDDWEQMPFNTIGEITIYSKGIMKDYLNNEEATQKIMKNGWMKTGDLGCIETNGCLNIVGRIKQIIICNGCNVNLLELEETVLECDYVYEVCATSIPYRDSEKPIIYVALRSSCSINVLEAEQMLFTHLKEKLADFKIPLYIKILDLLPKNVTGKIDRKTLAERALTECALK